MDETKVNGNPAGAPMQQKIIAAAAPQHPGPGTNISAEAQLQAAIEPVVSMVTGVMIKGIVLSVGQVPPHIAMNAVCKAVGQISAGMIDSPDLALILNIRRGFKEAFDAGVAAANKQSFAPPGKG
jgi:hypothetical protein